MNILIRLAPAIFAGLLFLICGCTTQITFYYPWQSYKDTLRNQDKTVNNSSFETVKQEKTK